MKTEVLACSRFAVLLLCLMVAGCASVRVTDPQRTATEQFLESEATRRAVEQLSADALRDRRVFLDATYLNATAYPLPENLFLLGELRSRLLVAGVRLVEKRDRSDIVLEV